MNKTTPRTDPVYNLPKPTDNAILQAVALNAVKQIAGHAGDAMRYMVETILTRSEPEISKDLNTGQTVTVKSKWAQRLEEMQEKQRQAKAPNFPKGGEVSSGSEFVQAMPNLEVVGSCKNCGKLLIEHVGPNFKCPK